MATVDELLKMFTDQFNLAFLQLDERRIECEDMKKSMQERNDNIDAKISFLAKSLKEIKGKVETVEKKFEEFSLEKVESKISEMTEQLLTKHLEKSAESFSWLESRIETLEDQNNSCNQSLFEFHKAFDDKKDDLNAKVDNLKKEIENISKKHETLNALIEQNSKEISSIEQKQKEIIPGLNEQEVQKLIKQYDDGIQKTITHLSESLVSYQDTQKTFENTLSEAKLNFLKNDDLKKINENVQQEISAFRTEIENSFKNQSDIDEKILSIFQKESEKIVANNSQALKEIESKLQNFSTKEDIEKLAVTVSDFEKSTKQSLETENANLGSKLEGYIKTNVFNSKLEQLKAFMTSKLETMLDEENAKINEEHKFTQTRVEALENHLKGSIEKAIESVKTLEDSIKKDLESSNSSHENKIEETAKQLHQALDTINHKLNTLEEQDKIFKSKILKDHETSFENFNLKINSLEEGEKELKKIIQIEMKSSIHEISSKLTLLEENEKLMEDKISKDIRESTFNLISRLESLENQMKDSQENDQIEFRAIKDDIKTKFKTIDEANNELDNKFSKNLESIMNDFSETMKGMKDHEKTSRENMEQDIKLSIENLTEKLKSLEEHEKESSSSNSKHFEHSISNLSSKFSAIEEQFKENKINFEHEFDKVKNELAQSETRLSQDFNKRLNSSNDSISSLETKITSSLTDASKKTDATINEVNVSIELVKQNIKKIVGDNQTGLSYQADQFKLSFVDMEEKIKQAISNLKKEIESEFNYHTTNQSEIKHLLETQVNEKSKELHSSIESLNQMIKNNSEQASKTISNFDTRIEEVATRVENIKQDIDDRIDKEIEIINNDQAAICKNLESQKSIFEKFNQDTDGFKNKIEATLTNHNESLAGIDEAKASILLRLENIEPKVLHFKENDDSRYTNFIEEFRKEKVSLETRFEELQKKAENLTNVVEEALVSDVTSFKKSIQLLTESSQSLIKDIKDIRELEMIEIKNDLIAEIENLSKKLSEYNTQSDANYQDLENKLNTISSSLNEAIENLSSSTKETINSMIIDNKSTQEQTDKAVSDRFAQQQAMFEQHIETFNNFKDDNINHLQDLETRLLTKLSTDSTKLEESIFKTNERFKERCNLQESKLNELRQEVEDQNCTEQVKKLGHLIEDVKTKQDEEFLGIKKKLISQDSSTKELEDYWNITYMNLKEKVQVTIDNIDTLRKKIPDAELVQRIPKMEEGMVRTNKAIANLEEHHRVDFNSYKEKNQAALTDLDQKLSQRISKLDSFSQDLSLRCDNTFEKINLEAQALAKLVQDHYDNRVTTEYVTGAIENESIRLLELITKTDGLIVDVEKKIGEQTVQYKSDIECLSKTVESAKKAYDNYNNKVSELAESDRKIQREIQKMINFNDIQQDDLETDNGAHITSELAETESGLSSNFEYKTDYDELVSHVQSSLKHQHEGFAKGVQAEVDSLSRLLKENHKILNQKTIELDSEHKKIITRQKCDAETLHGINSKIIEVSESVNHLNQALSDTTKSVWDTIGMMNDRIFVLETKK